MFCCQCKKETRDAFYDEYNWHTHHSKHVRTRSEYRALDSASTDGGPLLLAWTALGFPPRRYGRDDQCEYWAGTARVHWRGGNPRCGRPDTARSYAYSALADRAGSGGPDDCHEQCNRAPFLSRRNR